MEASKKPKKFQGIKISQRLLTEIIEQLLYLSPTLFLLSIFLFWSFFKSNIRSVHITDNLRRNSLFVDLEKYIELFKCSSFHNSLIVTNFFDFIVVIVGVLLGFFTALLCQ